MSIERKVDVAIIGAGTAGLSASSEVGKVTDNFVLINGGLYGTTCARVGCMPSKVLIQVANDFQRRHVLATQGILGGEHLHVSQTRVLAYVRSLRDRFVRGVLATIEQLGDRNIQGFARFREPTLLEVEGKIIQAKRVIIATGSSPVVPETWQSFSDRILTTDNLFEQDDLPARVAVIGLGVVGVELGQALARLGVETVGVNRSNRLAGLTDPTVIAYLQETLSQEFPLHTGTTAEVQSGGEKLAVHFDDKIVHTEKILASLGRRPNVAKLGLEALGFQLDEQGLPPYDPTTMQVGNLPIFIAGDANAESPVLHEAADEGRIAGFNSVQENPHCFQRRTKLNIVFSEPNVAVVGSSFSELQNQDIAVGEIRFDNQGRARVMAENTGILRVYGDKRRGHLRGAELVAPRGEHLAHLLAWAMQKEMTIFEMLQLPFYHPVVEEGLRTALRDLSKQIHTTRPVFELALCDSNALAEMG